PLQHESKNTLNGPLTDPIYPHPSTTDISQSHPAPSRVPNGQRPAQPENASAPAPNSQRSKGRQIASNAGSMSIVQWGVLCMHRCPAKPKSWHIIIQHCCPTR
ncbi:hypothetical protein BDW74DRAFT_148681, partial [Aspergillus multicolor]|uniref:uncharacterized protein n=1 Tax=Aspergillus multicolor TaxID=41759 RepID=UPI003CCCDFBA